jgi:hypothetical protein
MEQAHAQKALLVALLVALLGPKHDFEMLVLKLMLPVLGLELKLEGQLEGRG